MNPLVEGLKKNKAKQAVPVAETDVDRFLAMFEQLMNAVNQKTAKETGKALPVMTQESHA